MHDSIDMIIREQRLKHAMKPVKPEELAYMLGSYDWRLRAILEASRWMDHEYLYWYAAPSFIDRDAILPARLFADYTVIGKWKC